MARKNSTLKESITMAQTFKNAITPKQSLKRARRYATYIGCSATFILRSYKAKSEIA